MAKKAETRKSQSFLQGALVLTVSVAIVKIIGAVFKIPMLWILGSVGNSYFTYAYDLYNPLSVLATAGFPIAIAKMVSENVARKRYRDVRRIHRISIPIFTVMGVVGFLLMIAVTVPYTNFIKNPNAKYATFMLAPTILFVCLMSIYRGYYEGMRNMVPTAASEIIEAVCKLTIGISASYLILKLGMREYANSGTVFGVPYETEDLAHAAVLPFAAAGAIAGIAIGALFGFIFLLIRHRIKGDGITREELACSPRPKSNRTLVKTLISVAIPVVMGAMVLNIASLVDSTLIARRLNSIMDNNNGYLTGVYQSLMAEHAISAEDLPAALYGCFSAAATIMMLVPAITQTFSVSALPTVSAAWTEGNHRKIKNSIETVVRVTTLVTIPAGLGMSVMAHPLMQLIYYHGNNQNEVDVIARCLTTLGIAVVFTSTSTPLCSMLQAVGRVDLPVKLLSIGLVIKIALNYMLVGIPSINIHGAGVGTLVCYAFITFAALFFLCREAHITPNLVSIFIKPLIASVLCTAAAWVMNSLLSLFLPARVATLFALCLSVLVYIVALLAIRAIGRNDILMLPKGQKIVKILEKHRWIE